MHDSGWNVSDKSFVEDFALILEVQSDSHSCKQTEGSWILLADRWTLCVSSLIFGICPLVSNYQDEYLRGHYSLPFSSDRYQDPRDPQNTLTYSQCSSELLLLIQKSMTLSGSKIAKYSKYDFIFAWKNIVMIYLSYHFPQQFLTTFFFLTSILASYELRSSKVRFLNQNI